MATSEDKHRRIKLGFLDLIIVVIVYAIAKITNDISGDWWKFSMLITGLIGWIEGCITLTDIFGLKEKMWTRKP